MALFQGLGSKNNQNQPSDGNANGRGITVKSVLRYSMMPEILPRIRALGFHFGHFAYLLAMVFASARLLPKNHPVMNPANMGQYGVRQVIAMAANNIKWSKDNIDQIAIFSAIVIGLIMIVIQAVLIMIAAVIGANPASAQDISGIFSGGDGYVAADDPIMVLFANVFGDLDGFWGTGVDAAAPNSGNMIHGAIRAMLSMFSTAMMVIAVIIIVYYIMSVVAEAAKTGTPFGQRFNSLYAPLRLVIALGLLVPLGSGLNTAQYITLWVAKMGSNLGTTVWNTALDEMNTSEADRYVLDDFKTSWIRDLSLNVFLMEVCAASHNKYEDISDSSNANYVKQAPKSGRDSFDTSTAQRGTPGRKNYRPATYGYEVVYRNDRTLQFLHGVKCGEISLKMSDEQIESSITASSYSVPTAEIFEKSKAAVDDVLSSSVIKNHAKVYADQYVTTNGTTQTIEPDDVASIFEDIIEEADRIEGELKTSFSSVGDTDFAKTMQEFIGTRGNSWVYAGTYYMEISRLIQASHDAKLNTIPNSVFVELEENNLGQEVSGRNKGRNGTGYRIPGASAEVSMAVYNLLSYYKDNRSTFITENADDMPAACVGVNDDSSGIDQVACTLFAMLVPDNLVMLATDENRNVDPLAALVSAGYEIISRAWHLLIASITVSAAGGILSIFGTVGGLIGGFLTTIGGVLIMLATFGLAAGVVLYFMLPIFPFMYFFFAVVSWVMEIFEAIIAMPLWALAHLRIEGDGLPGQAAVNGYYLLLAIFLRPVMIVIGLIAGLLIFSGIVFLLQHLWAGVLLVKGAGSMSGLEVLVYTIIFSYFCYSAAVTSFKLVDTIPNQILRWIGNNPGTFSDNKEDPMGQSNALLTAGAGFFAGNMAGKLSEGSASMGANAGKGLKSASGYQTKDEREKEDLLKQQQQTAATRHNEMMGGLNALRQPDAPAKTSPSRSSGSGKSGADEWDDHISRQNKDNPKK